MNSMSRRTGLSPTPFAGSRRFAASGKMERPGAMKSIGIGSLAVIIGLSLAAWAPVAVALNAVIN
jgi:hypothetical protein